MRIKEIKCSDGEAVVEFVLIVQANGSIDIARQESAMIGEIDERHDHRGDVMWTRFHEIAVERIVDVDPSMHIADDDLPLTIVETASADLFAGDVIVTAACENKERGRWRETEREREGGRERLTRAFCCQATDPK